MTDGLVPALAAAVASLVTHIDQRGSVAEDDDVRALEDVAIV